jgi:hypothetical protein
VIPNQKEKTAMKMKVHYRGPYNGNMAYSVHWQDEGARYHVWLTDEFKPSTGYGERSPTLYKNSHANYREPGHFPVRKLDLHGKAHAKVRAAIEALPASAFEEARAEYEREEAAKAAAERAAVLDDLRDRARRFGYDLTAALGEREREEFVAMLREQANAMGFELVAKEG